MLGKYNSKNDGYIKNQNIKLNEARKIILMKIAFVVVPLVLLNTFIWCVCARSTPPEKWLEKQITYEAIARQHRNGGSYYVIKTAEGKNYVIGVGTEEAELISQELIKGQQYTIVYYQTPITMITCSLSLEDKEFVSLDKSIEKWENKQKIFYVIFAVSLVIMPPVILINTRKEFRQIRGIKQKIAEREAKRLNSHK